MDVDELRVSEADDVEIEEKLPHRDCDMTGKHSEVIVRVVMSTLSVLTAKFRAKFVPVQGSLHECFLLGNYQGKFTRAAYPIAFTCVF